DDITVGAWEKLGHSHFFRIPQGIDPQKSTPMKTALTLFLSILPYLAFAQRDMRLYDIIQGVSAQRIERDVTILANFGTRHTLSDTLSQTRGIGAARRWIKSEFEAIS